MWAQLTRRTLLSMTLGLLFLRPVALANCTANCIGLLWQLKQQIAFLKDSNNFLNHSIKALTLKEDACDYKHYMKSVEVVGTFPSTDDLWGLSRLDFLHTVRGKQEQVKHKFESTLKFINLSEAIPINRALSTVRGFSNNLYCMAQKLSNHSWPTEPTQEVPRTPTTPTPKTFEAKLRLCRLLRGYHSFMESVAQVFNTWEDCSSRRRRGRPNPWKITRRSRGSRRGKKFISRGLSPQKLLGTPVDESTADAL